jgi:hypothetical protein
MHNVGTSLLAFLRILSGCKSGLPEDFLRPENAARHSMTCTDKKDQL